MGSKIRSDSLYARLSPEQREELFVMLVEQGLPYELALLELEKWGVRASLGSLSNFVNRHGMDWRLKRAAQMASEAEGKLPDGWEKAQKLALAQKEFELSFRDLSLKEYVALQSLRLDIETAEKKAKLEERKLALAERRVKVLEAKMREAKEKLEAVKTKGGLTKETLRQIEEAAGLL